MQDPTARNLRAALQDLERARTNLENAPDEEVVDRAVEYQQARARSLPCFEAAQREFDLSEAGASTPGTPPAEPGAEQPEQPAMEASEGVPLVQPPGVVIDAANLERYGPLVAYAPRETVEGAPEQIEATPYAFDTGTAVDTGTEEGQVGISEPSRIVRGTEAGTLGVVANATFNETYVPVDQAAAEQAAEEAGGEAAEAVASDAEPEAQA